MKLLRSVVIIFLILILSARSSLAEIFQLTPINRTEEVSKPEDSTPEQLLEKERGKKFVIMFLKLSPEKKFQVTSGDYKKKGLSNSPELFKKIFDKESYFKIDFQKINLFDQEKARHMEIKANLYWLFEGYEGVQTFYFNLVKEKDQWLLDWLIY